MKTFSWNCQGLGNPRTVKTLQSWCWRERPNLVFLMETKVDLKKLQRVKEKCGFVDGLCLSSKGLSGGLGFWWNDINVKVISYSAHHVMVEVCDGNDRPSWATMGIYGWPELENKHLTWQLMRSIKEATSLPIIFFGDFNEILHGSEKDGGAIRRERYINALREVVDVCELRDLGFRGSPYTWQRGNDPAMVIRERLDRFLASDDWCNIYVHSLVRHYPIYKSDHAPILLSADVQPPRRKRKKLFYFEALWLSNSKCYEVVQQAWASGAGLSIGARMAACADKVGSWAATMFGDVKKRVKRKEEELEGWQSRVPDSVMLNKCRELVGELDELHRLEESYWHARARVNELRDGDKNTSYFHHKASYRKRRNAISQLKDECGVLKVEEEEIGDIISAYFTNMFSSSLPSGFDEALAGISLKVGDDSNAALNDIPTRDEIHYALFQMHPNKAPGIDGMHALFYHKFWPVVGDDVVQFVQQWWDGEVDLRTVNETCITLIPKYQNPIQMGDFSPLVSVMCCTK